MAVGRKTGGRQKGTPNKTTAELKDVIMGAFNDMGGQESLLAWAVENPNDFYTKILVKVLPRTIDGELKHTVVEDLTERLMSARKNAEASRKPLN